MSAPVYTAEQLRVRDGLSSEMWTLYQNAEEWLRWHFTATPGDFDKEFKGDGMPWATFTKLRRDIRG